jgi:hypothetical protein
MKYLVILIGIVIASSSQYKDANKKNVSDSYRVTKIDSINYFYLVYAQKKDSLYKIVSKKEAHIDCKKIKVGVSYKFVLHSMRENAPIIGNIKIAPVNYADVNCYQFDEKTKICKEEGIYDLYFVNNLHGLCFKNQ